MLLHLTRLNSLDSTPLQNKVFFIIIKHNVVHIRMCTLFVSVCLLLVICINIFNDPVCFVFIFIWLYFSVSLYRSVYTLLNVFVYSKCYCRRS